MSKINHRLKRSNKFLRILFYLITIIYIVSYLFFLKSILSLNGIETIFRIIVVVFFILYLIIYILLNLKNLIKKKYKGLIITSILSIIFIAFFLVSTYYINFVYKSLNNITENEELTYTSYLITLKTTEFNEDLEIGIIDESVNSDDYTLANKLYSKYNLSNNTKKYDDYLLMIDDLLNKKIDAIFVPGNYITLFENEFEELSTSTKVIYSYKEKLKNEDLDIVSTKEFDEPLTFLFLGVDSETNGLNESAAFNGDTLMLLSFNPHTLDTVMLSIPRDTYVPIACRNGYVAKINSSAAYGTSCVINTINDLLDINIDYYVKINFKGAVELVDALGGIIVDVEKPYYNTYKGQMCEQNSDREFGNNLVCVNPGIQTLNGEQALAYARNRHLYIGSDLDRVRHQQQVVEAIASKLLEINSLSEIEDVINAVSNNLASNMSTNTMLSGYQVIKKMLTTTDSISFNKATLETYSLRVFVPGRTYTESALGYYSDSLEDIKKAFNVVLGKDEEEVIKTFSFNVNTLYEVPTPGKGKAQVKTESTLASLVGYTLDEAKSYCNKNNISCSVEYEPSDTDGYVLKQSVTPDTLLSRVDSITLTISEIEDTEEE